MGFSYKEIETQSREEINQNALEQINRILSQVENTPYYKGKLPKEIECLNDFSKLPLLSKDDLRKAFPFGMLSCPKEDIVRMNASSGTTGIPTLSYCNKNDLDSFTQNEALHFSHTGLSQKDIMQVMVGCNLFTAGWGCYHGGIELGASIIPSGPGNTERQINLLKQLKPNYCFSNPSYLQHLLEMISQEDWKNISLKTAITGGEVLTKEFQKLAKEKYNLEIYNFYGMTEFSTHIASECHLHNGLHINENCFWPEIIDPETGQVLPDGEYGELVLTDLRREAMPLIRYRTGDCTRIIPEECSCGRTHRRIETITHRIDDMMIINGVNIFPSQIEECIYRSFDCATNYLIYLKKKEHLTKMHIDIEVKKELLENKCEIKNLEKNLMNTLKSYITIKPKLNFVVTGTLPEITGKTKRIVIK